MVLISGYRCEDSAKEETEQGLHQEVRDIYRKLEKYLAHVKKNMVDMVPKAITYSIITDLVNHITFTLMHQSTVIPSANHVSSVTVTNK